MEEILKKEYKDSLTIIEGLRIIIKAFQKLLDSNFSMDRLEAAYITTKDKKIVNLAGESLDKFLKEKKK